ncbi:hypothetical protein V8E54_006888 [Elaphomyces granulatus]
MPPNLPNLHHPIDSWPASHVTFGIAAGLPAIFNISNKAPYLTLTLLASSLPCSVLVPGDPGMARFILSSNVLTTNSWTRGRADQKSRICLSSTVLATGLGPRLFSSRYKGIVAD